MFFEYIYIHMYMYIHIYIHIYIHTHRHMNQSKKTHKKRPTDHRHFFGSHLRSAGNIINKRLCASRGPAQDWHSKKKQHHS